MHRSRNRLVFALLLVGAALAAAPVLLSLHLARKHAMSEKFEQLDAAAEGVVLQIRDARQMLTLLVQKERDSHDPPCSKASISRLQQFGMRSRAVKSTLRIENGQVMCSSSGELMRHLQLGRADMHQGDGTTVYIDVRVPGVPGQRFVVIERDGYGLLLLTETLTAPFAQNNVSLGIFGVNSGRFSARQGRVEQRWTQGLRPGAGSDHFVDEQAQFLVVRKLVSADSSAVLAAAPLRTIDDRVTQFGRWFIPLGILLGAGVLALTVLITRMQFSPRSELMHALRRNQLFLLYQPVFDLQTNCCIGAEALLRWRQEDGTILAPDRFIPFAEDAGMIHLLTQRMLQLVRQDLTGFLREHRQFHLAVNLAPSDLQCQRTPLQLAQLIEAIGPGCGQLVVEVTERALLEESSALGVLKTLRGLGIQIAIDDFGTGYSSLAYLTTYPFDILKIDKAFVTTACTDAVTSQVALHIVELGRTLGMRTLTEGIETRQQAEFFREQGVMYAQGYLFAKPMPVAELIPFVGRHARAPTPPAP
ncbi:EAL domain-containing protein [Stenotrophomonas sp. YIM B06876]|uniref:EAL domain-containing protein n=1 Tax=Stenotrophomonas sp. YIM B06876 TaxID=3060211 RepID=UPI0027386D3E|nr:EAL domain-containing protein [Stenotrophomonas sp. YIM B06876]